MRRTLVATGSFTLLLGAATGVAGADVNTGDHGGSGPVVVATGLNSPRQLNWAGDTLLIAEAGQGGEDCGPPAPGDPICAGPTGRISAVPDADHTFHVNAETLVDGLFSVETPEGTIGSDGVAWTGFPGVYLIAEGEPTFDALAEPGVETDDPAAETQEHLLVSVGGHVFPWVDLGEQERLQNPDKAQLDSNPNAVIVVDPTPTGEPGNDEYALVADAGANTVWKVTPDFSDLDENGLPAATVTVFAAYVNDDPAAPEFVPSALDQDEHGNIYVGGVGSFVPGGAAVVRYDSEGSETARWDGFTAINGLAVDKDGEELYVSQIFGNEGKGTGNVVRVDIKDKTWAAVDVPFPSGVAVDDSVLRHSGHGSGDRVFASVFSLSPADADDPTTPDVMEGGQVWRFSFPEHADEAPLPVTPPPAG